MRCGPHTITVRSGRAPRSGLVQGIEPLQLVDFPRHHRRGRTPFWRPGTCASSAGLERAVNPMQTPSRWEDLLRALADAFGRDHLSQVAELLRPLKPKAWAETLLAVPEARHHPEVVLMLLHAFPDAPAGVFADLLSIFQPTPVPPREQTDLFGDTPDSWVQWPTVSPVPASRSEPLLSTTLLRLQQPDRTVRLTQPVARGAIAMLITKLGCIVDFTAIATMLAKWLEQIDSPAIWDELCHEFALTRSGEFLHKIWPRLSPRGAVEAIGRENWPWTLETWTHPDARGLWTAIVQSDAHPAVRGRALAKLLLAGYPSSPVDDLDVLAHAFAPLKDGTHLGGHPASTGLLRNIVEGANAELARRSAALGYALGAALAQPPPQRSADRARLVDLGLDCLTSGSATPASQVALVSAPLWREDEIARRRMADALGRLSEQRLADIFETAPFALCVALARSTRTPLLARASATWAALNQPEFQAKDADITGDPALLVSLYSQLMLAGIFGKTDRTSAARHVVIATITTYLRLGPPLGAYDEQTSPWFRLRDGLRHFCFHPNIVDAAYEHLVDKLLAAIQVRIVGAVGRNLEDLIRSAIRLADPRLKPIIRKGLQALGPQAAIQSEVENDAYFGYDWLVKVPERGERLGWALMMLQIEAAGP